MGRRLTGQRGLARRRWEDGRRMEVYYRRSKLVLRRISYSPELRDRVLEVGKEIPLMPSKRLGDFVVVGVPSPEYILVSEKFLLRLLGLNGDFFDRVVSDVRHSWGATLDDLIENGTFPQPDLLIKDEFRAHFSVGLPRWRYLWCLKTIIDWFRDTHRLSGFLDRVFSIEIDEGKIKEELDEIKAGRLWDMVGIRYRRMVRGGSGSGFGG